MHEWSESSGPPEMPPELRGLRYGVPEPPGPEIVRAVLLASALDRTPAPREEDPVDAGGACRSRRWLPSGPIARVWTLLTIEAQIMRRSIWLVSALIMATGVGFALLRGDSARLMLSLAAPLIAGFGVAGSYDPGRGGDTAAELVATTPTSRRVIMLARMTLAFGYDLGLALLGSAVAHAYGSAPEGMSALVIAWLGPMALLAALSLLLAVCWHAEGAIGVAVAVWTLYALTFVELPTMDGMRAFWASSPMTLGLALVLALAAVIAAGRREPIRFGGATHRP